MKPTIGVSSSGDGGRSLGEALAKLARKQVYVGIPEDENQRSSGDITNAQLLYIQTNGSALRGIPARPVIEPAIEAQDNKLVITHELGDAMRSALDGNPTETTEHLERAGTLGANAAKNWFTDSRNAWPALKPSTVKRKGSDRPLVHTGQLRRAITYLVEEK